MENRPHYMTQQINPYRVIDAELDQLLQEQEAIVRRPFSRGLLFSRIVEPVVVLVRSLKAILESTKGETRITNALMRASLHPRSISCFVVTFTLGTKVLPLDDRESTLHSLPVHTLASGPLRTVRRELVFVSLSRLALLALVD